MLETRSMYWFVFVSNVRDQRSFVLVEHQCEVDVFVINFRGQRRFVLDQRICMCAAVEGAGF